MKNFLVSGVLLLLSVSGYSNEQQIDSEIATLRKELSRIQSERQKVKQEFEKDRADFQSYQKRTENRFGSVRAQADSIRTIVVVANKKSDSLSVLITAVGANIRQVDLQHQRLKDIVSNACDQILELTKSLTPMTSAQVKGAADYLKSELLSGSISTTEAIQRILQISRDIEQNSFDIQITEGVSPVQSIRGTVHRIRFGHFFEACVDAQGEKAAIWGAPSDSIAPEWIVVDDPQVGASLLKAVQVREGKTLPVLVDLPLGSVLQGVKHD